LELETPDGALVTAQVSVTVPVNVLAGVTEIVEVPVLAAVVLMVMLVGLLVRVKLAPFPPGACQKFPQPARSIAAANNPAQRPIFIAAPRTQYSGYTRKRSPTLF
jgi:hypothetical protein